MRKYIAALLVAALAAGLCACGCTNQATPSTDTTPTVIDPDPTVDPLPDPTSGTNIPDPTVDENSTENGSLIDDITEMTGDHNNG